MLPYIIVFTITIITTYISDKLFKRERKILGWIFAFVGILVLSFLAAVRDDDIGKDIPVYLLPAFEWAYKFPFLEFIKIGNLELGFMTIVFLFTKIFRDYHYILFFLELIVDILVFTYAYKRRKKASFFLIIIIFIFLYYSETLVMIRQGVALMIGLLSIELLQEKKYISTFALFVLALLFHTTSILLLILYFIVILENTSKINKRTKKIIYITMISGVCIVLIALKPIIELFTVRFSILPVKFYNYFNLYYVEELMISKSMLLFKIFWLFIALIVMNKNNDKEIKISILFLIIDFIFYIGAFKLIPLLRCGLYFTVPAYMMLIPAVPKIFKEDSKNKYCINFIIALILGGWWYFAFVIQPAGVCPYTSSILTNFLNNF